MTDIQTIIDQTLSQLAEAGMPAEAIEETRQELAKITMMQDGGNFVGGQSEDKVIVGSNAGQYAQIDTKGGEDVAVSYNQQGSVNIKTGAKDDAAVIYNDGGVASMQLQGGEDTGVAFATDHGGVVMDGGNRDDTLLGVSDNGGVIDARGGRGDDTVVAASTGGGIVHASGGKGDDTLLALGQGSVDAGVGDDTVFAVPSEGHLDVATGPGTDTTILVDGTGGSVNMTDFAPQLDTLQIILQQGCDNATLDAGALLESNQVTGINPDEVTASCEASTEVAGQTVPLNIATISGDISR